MRRVGIHVWIGILGSALASVAPAQMQADDEETHVLANSQEFLASGDRSIDALLGQHFEKGLRSPKLGAVSTETFNHIVAEIKRQSPIPNVTEAVEAGSYDVILQPGHYLRTQGRTGATGHRVTEQALVAYLVGPIADSLRKQGLRVLVLRADPTIKGPLKANIFLAIHAEGSPVACAGKPSLGYERKTSPMAMHALGWALAQALGYSYEDFQRDNFTANEAAYYMFRSIQTTYMKGVLEIGEITCADKEDMLIRSSDEIAHNVTRALSFIAGH